MNDPIPFAIINVETLPCGPSTVFLQEDGSHHASLTNTLTSLVRNGHKFTLEFPEPPEPPQPMLPCREDIEAICRRCFGTTNSAVIFPKWNEPAYRKIWAEGLDCPDFIVKVPRVLLDELEEMRDALMGYPDMNEVDIELGSRDNLYLMIEVRFRTVN